MKSLYETLKAAGVELNSNCSDLYFPVTKQTREILKQFPTENKITTIFTNQLTKKPSYCTPFAYMPFWEKVANHCNPHAE